MVRDETIHVGVSRCEHVDHERLKYDEVVLTERDATLVHGAMWPIRTLRRTTHRTRARPTERESESESESEDFEVTHVSFAAWKINRPRQFESPEHLRVHCVMISASVDCPTPTDASNIRELHGKGEGERERERGVRG